eukprot:c9942_g1_i2.p1 GENE.c9942_g1_i2~~c9942_g1_i2.p1  ORF type:complete len:326 (+),score=76.68 c9942_g1_i2:29-979(+)
MSHISRTTQSHAQVVALHSQMKTSTMLIRKRRCEFNQIVREVIALEDIMLTAGADKRQNSGPVRKVQKHQGVNIPMPLVLPESSPKVYEQLQEEPSGRVSWFRMTRAKTRLALRFVGMKSLFLLTSIVSLIVLWSELAMAVWFVNISIFGLLSHLRTHYLFLGGAVLVLAYVTFCTYRTLFHVKILDYVHLVPNGQSDPYSLLFISGYSCRFVIPTCYNVLNMARISGTVFSQLLGTGTMTAALGAALSQAWAPLVMIVVAAITWADCGLCSVPLDDEDESEGRDAVEQIRSKVKGGRIGALSRVMSQPHNSHVPL